MRVGRRTDVAQVVIFGRTKFGRRRPRGRGGQTDTSASLPPPRRFPDERKRRDYRRAKTVGPPQHRLLGRVRTAYGR